MISITKEMLSFENDCWGCSFEYSKQALNLRIKGDAHFFDDGSNLDGVNRFAGSLAEIEKCSLNYVDSSEYRDEVRIAGNLILTSISIESSDEYRVWFKLGENSDRLLGVHYKDNEAMSVYCDPP